MLNEDFIINLTKTAETHSEWLAIIRFGLQGLLEDSNFLTELIYFEAKRVNERDNLEARMISDDFVKIFMELNLSLVIED